MTKTACELMNALTAAAEDAAEMTACTMEIGYPVDECFPYKASRRVVIDGVEYVLRVAFDVTRALKA